MSQVNNIEHLIVTDSFINTFLITPDPGNHLVGEKYYIKYYVIHEMLY